MQSKSETRFRTAALVWCVGVSLIYLYVCIRTLLESVNPGTDMFWAILFCTIATSVILARLFLPVAVLRTAAPAVVAVAAGVIVVRSGSVAGLLIGALMIAAALGAGELLMRLFRFSDATDRDAERLLVSVIAGVGLLGVAAVVLAALKLLTLPVVAPLLAALALFAALRLRSFFRTARSHPGPDEHVPELPILRSLGGYVLILNLIWAVAPEVQYDALNYHLPVAAAFGREGRLVDLLFNHSYLAGLIESFYALAFVFDSRVAAEMMPFAFSLLATGCVFMLTRRLAGRRAAAWAALLFYSTPLILWASSTTDVDLAVGAFIGAATIGLIRWRESGRVAWFYLSAIIMGAGVGAKPTIGMMAPAVAVLCVHFLVAGRDAPFFKRLRTVLFAITLVIVMSAPWYLIRAHYTSNPVYPALKRYFPGHRLVYGRATLGGNFRIPFEPASIAFFPIQFTFRTAAYSESGVTSGGVGPWLLLAIPMIPLAFRRDSPSSRLVCGIAFCYVALWTITFSYARYYIPILPLVVPLGASLVTLATRRSSAAAIAIFSVVLAGQSFSIPAQYWNFSDRIPIRNALGLESDEHFLERVHPGMSAVGYINRNAAPGDKAIGLGFERVRHYLEIPFHSWRGIPELRPISRIEDPAELAEALRALEYDWLIIDLREPDNHERYLSEAFRSQHAKLRYEGANHVVYRLAP